jgi:hypothetical protein
VSASLSNAAAATVSDNIAFHGVSSTLVASFTVALAFSLTLKLPMTRGRRTNLEFLPSNS